jgi:hypothetical protein
MTASSFLEADSRTGAVLTGVNRITAYSEPPGADRTCMHWGMAIREGTWLSEGAYQRHH